MNKTAMKNSLIELGARSPQLRPAIRPILAALAPKTASVGTLSGFWDGFNNEVVQDLIKAVKKDPTFSESEKHSGSKSGVEFSFYTPEDDSWIVVDVTLDSKKGLYMLASKELRLKREIDVGDYDRPSDVVSQILKALSASK